MALLARVQVLGSERKQVIIASITVALAMREPLIKLGIRLRNGAHGVITGTGVLLEILHFGAMSSVDNENFRAAKSHWC